MYKTIKQALENISKIKQSARDMTDDPMTEAMHAPVDDFRRDRDFAERKAWAFILNRAKPGSKTHIRALGELERWSP